MLYTFELTFTGLCVFTTKGEDYRHPEEVNALLIDTRPHQDSLQDIYGSDHCDMEHQDHPEHFPLLSICPQDILDGTPPEFRLVPTPSGEQVAVRSLGGQTLTIRPPDRIRYRLSMNWQPDDYREIRPEGSGQEDWMDWATPLFQMYPAVPPPTQDMPYAGLNPRAVASVVTMYHGELTGEKFPRLMDNDDYVAWRFKDLSLASSRDDQDSENGKEDHVQALAGTLCLKITGLDAEQDFITLASDQGWEISLQPYQSRANVVRASITNLLNREPETDPESLDHFYCLKTLAYWNPDQGEPKIPTKDSGTVTTSSTFCPPVIHREG